MIYEGDAKGRKRHKSRPIYEATRSDADAMFQILLAKPALRGASQAELILFLADGGEWSWNRIPWLVKELGIDPDRVVQAVDYYHACQHLYKVAELRSGWDKNERDRRVARMNRHLLAGRVDKVIASIGQLCRGRGLG